MITAQMVSDALTEHTAILDKSGDDAYMEYVRNLGVTDATAIMEVFADGESVLLSWLDLLLSNADEGIAQILSMRMTGFVIGLAVAQKLREDGTWADTL